MSEQGPDNIPISWLESQVEVNLGDSEQVLSAHRESMRQAKQDTDALGLSEVQLAQQAQRTAQALNQLNAQLAQQERTNAALRQMAASGEGAGLPGGVEAAIARGEERADAFRAKIAAIGETGQQAAQELGTSFAQAAQQMATGEAQVTGAVQQTNRAIEDGIVQLRRAQEFSAGLEKAQVGMGGPGVNPELDAHLAQARAEVERLTAAFGQNDQAASTMANESTQAASRMRQGFLTIVQSVDDLRKHYDELRDVQARAAQQGIVMPAVEQDLRRTGSLLRQFQEGLNEEAQVVTRNLLQSAVSVDELRAHLEALNTIKAQSQEAGVFLPGVDRSIKQVEAAIDSVVGKTRTAGRDMAQNFLATTSSIDELQKHLDRLYQIRARGIESGITTKDLDQEISRTEQRIKSLQDTTRVAARDMTQNFLANVHTIDELKAHYETLQQQIARGQAAGIRTPNLAAEARATVGAIRELEPAFAAHEKTVARVGIQYSVARSVLSTVSSEMQRMVGVSMPGLSQVQGVSAGLAEKFIGIGGASSVAVLGIGTVAVVATTGAAALGALGASAQEAEAKIATSGNITIQAAREQEKAFEGTRSGAVATATAYASVAGMLRTYTGQALTTAQATEFMAVAQDGATARGEKLDQVTSGLARALVATHTPLSQSRDLMDVLYVTSQNTGLSIDQVGLSAARMVERTGEAAPSVRDLGIALTLAAQAGAQGQQGLEPVDNLIRNLSNSSPKAKQDLEGLGIAVAKNAQGGLDLAQTLLNLKGGYDGLANDAQRFQLAQELAGQGAATLQAMLRLTNEDIQHVIDSYNEHNRVAEDAKTHAETLGGMFGKLAMQAKDAATETGEHFAGALITAGQNADTFGTTVSGVWKRIEDAYAHYYDYQRTHPTQGDQPDQRTVGGMTFNLTEEQKIEQARNALQGGDIPRQDLARSLGAGLPAYQPPGATQTEIDSGAAMAAQMRADQEEAQANFQQMMAQQQAQQEAAATAAGAVGTQLPGIKTDELRQQQELLDSLGTEAARLHLEMVAIADTDILPGDRIKAYETFLSITTQEEAAIRRAYDPAAPQQMIERLTELQTLTKQYDAAVKTYSQTQSEADRQRVIGTQVQIDLLNQRIQRENLSHEQSQKDASFQRQQAAEATRQARATQEADPLYGLNQAMQKDREDLIGTAGQVMGDLRKAIELKGTEGARAAGEAFGTEARKWGEELEKAGVPGWQESFNHLISLGKDAIASGSPDVIAAIHDFLEQGTQEIRDANIGRAMEDVMAKANTAMIESELKTNDQLLRSQVSAGLSRADTLQQEVDREYDIWAGRQIERLMDTTKNEQELVRIRDEWGREDADRAEQRMRERADRDEQANRATRDRAETNARAMVDMQEQQGRAASATTRARTREDADALYEHQKRLAEIQKQGGKPEDVTKATTEENTSYDQGIKDRARKRDQDDAENRIRLSEQVADAQKRQSEQVTDANRKAAEQAADLVKRQGEQEADTTKARSRQLADRATQEADATHLKDRRIELETQYHTEAEGKAQQRFQNELARIDARYQHEEQRAQAQAQQAALRAQHDEAVGGIKAQERFGEITPEKSTQLQNEAAQRFAQQSAAIQNQLTQNEYRIDRALAEQIAGRQKYAPGFAPEGVPFELTPQYAPPAFGPGLKRGLSTTDDSLFSMQEARQKTLPLQFMGQDPTKEPIPVILPDQQVRDIADGVGNLPPIEMDGEAVESHTSRVRRNRQITRTLG